MTAKPRSTDTSTELGLRSAALRIAGDLNSSIDTAIQATAMARREAHPARLVHAVFQHAIALSWAGLSDECAELHGRELRPLAQITNARWLAWSRFVEGNVAILRLAPDEAAGHLLAAELGFRAELSWDGVRSVYENRLTVARLANDLVAFDEALRALRARERKGQEERWYTYTGKRSFAAQLVRFEEAECARTLRLDHVRACRLHEALLPSPFVLISSLARLGLAALSRDAQRANLASQVAAQAAEIGARGIEQQAIDIGGIAQGPCPPIIFAS